MIQSKRKIGISLYKIIIQHLRLRERRMIFCGTLLKNHLMCGWIFRRVKFARLRRALIYNSCRSKRCVDFCMRMISGAWSFTPVWIFIQPQHFGCSSFAPRFMAILCHARCSTCDINNENYVLRPLNKKIARRRCTYFRPQHTHVPTICRLDLSTALVAYHVSKIVLVRDDIRPCAEPWGDSAEEFSVQLIISHWN